MENEKNIEKTTRLEPRSVLLIDGRGGRSDGWLDGFAKCRIFENRPSR